MSFIWNIYALAYDVINKNEPYKDLLKDVEKALDLKPGAELLNVGCGTGNLERLLVDRENIVITSIDGSKEMLKRAKKKLSCFKNINFIKTNINQVFPFEKETFDLTVAVNSIYAADDPRSVIKEMVRVLKKSGKLVFADPHDKADLSKIIKAQRKQLGVVKFILRIIINSPALVIVALVNKFYIKGKQKNFFNPNELKDILQNEGLADINIDYAYAGQDLLISATKI